MNKTTDFGIAGAGLSGCYSALMLSRVHGNKVTLLEEQSLILNGACLVGPRIHLGGEYPLDPETQIACLEASVVLALAWQTGSEKDWLNGTGYVKAIRDFCIDKKTWFAVANATEKRKENPFTLKQFIESYEQVKERYRGIFNEVMERKGWSAEFTAHNLFGPPDDFYKVLPKHKLKGFRDLAGAVETQEIGWNIPVVLSLLQKALTKSGVNTLTNNKVEKIEWEGNQFAIHYLNRHKNTLKVGDHFSDPRSPEIITSIRERAGNIVLHQGKGPTIRVGTETDLEGGMRRRVVGIRKIDDRSAEVTFETRGKLIAANAIKAGWDGNQDIKDIGAPPARKPTLHKRRIFRYEIWPTDIEHPIFVIDPVASLEQEINGGMISPDGIGTALVYAPGRGRSHLTGDSEKSFADIHEHLTGKRGLFPCLKDGRLIKDIERNVLTFPKGREDILTKRPHEFPRQIREGEYELNANKAVYALIEALWLDDMVQSKTVDFTFENALKKVLDRSFSIMDMLGPMSQVEIDEASSSFITMHYGDLHEDMKFQERPATKRPPTKRER